MGSPFRAMHPAEASPDLCRNSMNRPIVALALLVSIPQVPAFAAPIGIRSPSAEAPRAGASGSSWTDALAQSGGAPRTARRPSLVWGAMADLRGHLSSANDGLEGTYFLALDREVSVVGGSAKPLRHVRLVYVVLTGLGDPADDAHVRKAVESHALISLAGSIVGSASVKTDVGILVHVHDIRIESP
jgi:hypothetical protein